MKILLQPAIILLLLFPPACSNEAAVKNTSENATTAPEQTATNAQTNHSSTGDSLVGEWEMVGSVVDTNDNLQIDEEERAKLQPATFKGYMKLNKDGSGLFTVAKMEGRYEIIVDKNNGRKFMTWYDKENGPHRVGSLMKITKNELTIKEPGGAGLFLWKRL